MRVLVLIPARAGSKRVPNKNVKLFGNKPLVQWTIEFAKSLQEKWPQIYSVMVSTDSSEVAELAKSFGVVCPWLRPAYLSSDFATSADVTIHAVNWYCKHVAKVDAILLLQPTSPFRTLDAVDCGLNSLKAHSSAVSLSPSKLHPQWTFELQNGVLKPLIHSVSDSRSQDLPVYYTLNGSFYLVRVDYLLRNGKFVDEHTYGVVCPTLHESVDIDTPDDWLFAEYLLDSWLDFLK